MKICKEAEMKKNLELVQDLKSAQIDFVAVPVLNQKEKKRFLKISHEQIKKIIEGENE